MSAAGEEVVRSMYAGFSSLAAGGDVEAYVRAHYDPEVEYTAVEEIEPIRGHEALIAWTERWFEAWEEFRAEVDEVTAIGDVLVVEITIRGRGRESGTTVDMRIFHVIELRDGRILRMTDHLNRDRALDAARRR